MKYISIISIIMIFSYHGWAQNYEPWFPYFSEDSLTYGFKNVIGEKKTEAIYEPVHLMRKMENIATVMEYDNVLEKYDLYYLLKDGRQIGRDSVYMFDAQFDCESEGLIKFIDKKTGLMGCFNAHGEIQIPAVYNHISPFNHGYAVALIGAQKKSWNHEGESGCDHWSWEGGKTVFINRDNNILINNFNMHDLDLDFYSIIISDSILQHPLYESFPSIDNKHYHFLNFNKEFEHYFFHQFIHDTDNLAHYFTVVTHWDNESEQWIFNWNEYRNKLVKRLMEEHLQNTNDWEYSIINNVNLIMDLETEVAFEKYMDNCFRHNYFKFPTFTIDFTHKKSLVKLSFDFIRTDDGYQLAAFNF